MDSSKLNFYEQRTIEWNPKNHSVVMIDQTLLPTRLEFAECTSVSEIVDSIKTMKVRGAPAIGVAGAMGVALSVVSSAASSKAALLRDVNRDAVLLKNARPTAVNLSWGVQEALQFLEQNLPDNFSKEEATDIIVDFVQRLADEDVQTNKKLSDIGAKLFRTGDSVLTHCK